MTARHVIASALLRIYPATWRREYGPELADMLLTDPLTVRIAGNVLCNGLWQRIRASEPSTLCGLAMMVIVLNRLVWNIAAPLPYGHDWTVLLQPPLKTLPTLTVKPLTSELYVLFLIGCAFWTHQRYGGPPARSAAAAVKMSFIAGLPVMAAGALMLTDILDMVVLAPGDAPTTFREHGFAYTYYSAFPYPPAPAAVLVSPLFVLPVSWLWGHAGGSLATRISRCRIARPPRQA